MDLLLAPVILIVLFRPVAHALVWAFHLAIGVFVLVWHAFLWVFWLVFGLWLLGRLVGFVLRLLAGARLEPDSYRWRPEDVDFPRWSTSR
jgi:hypothetical protein